LNDEWWTPHHAPVACVLAFSALLPHVLACLVPLIAVFEATERPHRHAADIERVTVVPRDEPLCDICRIERLVFYQTSGDAQRLFGVVCDRPGWLVPRAVPDHLVESSMFSTDLRRRRKLDWSAKCIPTR